MKIDTNDKKFSYLKRLHHKVCQRCMKNAKLQTCHIFSRRYYSTRFNEDNAIVLCYACHSWFDTHKITACLFDEKKRVFDKDEESFHFLVEYLGYTWKQLEELYHLSQQPFRGYKYKKKEITKYLNKRINDKLSQ